MQKKVMTGEAGFSLIELMIVVAIIGVLAAIAVPNFRTFQAKSKQSEAKSILTAIYTANKAFQAEWMTYNGDFGHLGFEPEGDLRYNTGFASAGPVPNPANYNGAPASGATDTTTFCATDLDCTDAYTPGYTPTALGLTSVTNIAFVAQANGDLDGDPVEDQWTIDQGKNLVSANAGAELAD